MGVEFRAAQSATYNRLRRFLPTIANVLGLDVPDLQAIGNWVEVAQGGFQDPQTRKARASIPMGVHYSAEKVLRSVQVKQRCVDRLLHLWKVKQPSLALTEEGLLPRDSWMWEEVMMAHATTPPTAGGLDDVLFEAIPVENETILPVENAELEPLEEEIPEDDASAKESENSSSDTSSSASDLTVDGADVVGICPDQLWGSALGSNRAPSSTSSGRSVRVFLFLGAVIGHLPKTRRPGGLALFLRRRGHFASDAYPACLGFTAPG